jgi:hypothetical protein
MITVRERIENPIDSSLTVPPFPVKIRLIIGSNNPIDKPFKKNIIM